MSRPFITTPTHLARSGQSPVITAQRVTKPPLRRTIQPKYQYVILY